MARDLGIKRGVVQQWWNRDSVPPIWIPKVVAAARLRGFEGVHEDALFGLAERKLKIGDHIDVGAGA